LVVKKKITPNCVFFLTFCPRKLPHEVLPFLDSRGLLFFRTSKNREKRSSPKTG
jgi:hypothetical protein